MKIAVTGGSGFLGREVVTQLRAVGHEVLAIARGHISAAGITQCDILDTMKLSGILTGSDVVIHCAALSAPWGKRVDFMRQNVEGTASVVRAANIAKVSRLIHVSSSSVYFSYMDKIGILESDAIPRAVNAYAESKQLAEFEVQKFSGEKFIARPRGIFGSGDLHLLPRLLKVMKSRPLPLLRQGRAVVDITDVAVVADALMAMIEAPTEACGIYNVSQGEPIIIRELVSRISEGLNISFRWRPLPMAVAMSGAKALELVARIDPWQREPLVTQYGLGLFAYSQTLDISKAKQNLGWTPKVSLSESLERTFVSLRHER